MKSRGAEGVFKVEVETVSPATHQFYSIQILGSSRDSESSNFGERIGERYGFVAR